ncbi:tRNA (guanine-N(7)-)-methyltransferase [Buchnera aphidicola (Phyllaphis fagi)]
MKNKLINNLVLPKYNLYGKFIRNTRSFICRSSRYSQKHINTIKKYWPSFGLNFQCHAINIQKIFNNFNQSTILDIGFGNGESLINTSSYNLDKNILGIEVYIPGVSSCIKKIHMSQINNVKIILHDAVEVLKYMIHDNTLNIIQCFFPDPWPKLRHHKRRILQKSFIQLLAKKQMYHGILYIVTDCSTYANDITKIINIIPEYTSKLENINYFSIFNERTVTKFEKKANILNRKIFNLIFQCIK